MARLYGFYKDTVSKDLMKQFGMSDQDLDNMENRMESMMEELGDSNPLSMMMNMTQAMAQAIPISLLLNA